MNYWWKIYFWISIILSVIWLISLFNEAIDIELILAIPGNLIAFLALYSFVFRRKLLVRKHWVVLFWFFLFYFLVSMIFATLDFISPENLDLFYQVYPKVSPVTGLIRIFNSLFIPLLTGMGWVFTVVFSLPIFYALQQLAYNKKLK